MKKLLDILFKGGIGFMPKWAAWFLIWNIPLLWIEGSLNDGFETSSLLFLIAGVVFAIISTMWSIYREKQIDKHNNNFLNRK